MAAYFDDIRVRPLEDTVLEKYWADVSNGKSVKKSNENGDDGGGGENGGENGGGSENPEGKADVDANHKETIEEEK